MGRIIYHPGSHNTDQKVPGGMERGRGSGEG
jgi:hypothetical protein